MTRPRGQYRGPGYSWVLSRLDEHGRVVKKFYFPVWVKQKQAMVEMAKNDD